jgi:hypothetical protein
LCVRNRCNGENEHGPDPRSPAHGPIYAKQQ